MIRRRGETLQLRRAMTLDTPAADVDVPPLLVVRARLVQAARDRAGDGFVAIGGFGAHGLAFAAQAKARGASAILFEPPAPRSCCRRRERSRCRDWGRGWATWPTVSTRGHRGR
jgi:hypothetical protein